MFSYIIWDEMREKKLDSYSNFKHFTKPGFTSVESKLVTCLPVANTSAFHFKRVPEFHLMRKTQ